MTKGSRSCILHGIREPRTAFTHSPTAMLLGIRPINDFAFKKTFGTAENRVALISLLNAILEPKSPIVDVTLENPYNPQDFKEDKLSILDVKAIDAAGAIYDIEMQLTIFEGLTKRIVFYGCELYAGQLKAGDDYAGLHPVYSICLVNGILWPDATRVHHAFRLADAQSRRILPETLEIHTLELGRYNLRESELRRPACWTAGCTGSCTPTSTSPPRCWNCCRSRRSGKRRKRSPGLHRSARTKRCTMHERKRFETGNGN